MFYALRPSPLLLIFVTSYLFWLASFGPIFMLILATGFALLVPAYAKYCFLALDASANGLAEPPVAGVELLVPHGEWRAHKFSFPFVFGLSVITWLWDGIGAWLALPLLFLFLALVPAAIVVIAIEDRFLRALNLRVLLEVIHKLGTRYWLLTGLLWLAIPTVFYLVVQQGWLFTALFVLFYNLLVVFHWLGRAIYARRDRFDFEPAISPERDAAFEEAERIRQRFRVLDRVYAQRRRPVAMRELLQYIATEPEPLTAHAWFHEQLMQWEKLRLPLEHARHYIAALRERGRHAEAEAILSRCQQADAGFTP